MKTPITNNPDGAAQISALHEQIMSQARKSLEMAIEIGRLLTEQKKKFRHGEWGSWTQSLPFCARTATNYMRLHREKNLIKSENVSDLAEAYSLLAGPPPLTKEEARRMTEALHEHLEGLATDVVPFITRLREIRDDHRFVPAFPALKITCSVWACHPTGLKANPV
jgi:hypothetical protein